MGPPTWRVAKSWGPLKCLLFLNSPLNIINLFFRGLLQIISSKCPVCKWNAMRQKFTRMHYRAHRFQNYPGENHGYLPAWSCFWPSLNGTTGSLLFEFIYVSSVFNFFFAFLLFIWFLVGFFYCSFHLLSRPSILYFYFILLFSIVVFFVVHFI